MTRKTKASAPKPTRQAQPVQVRYDPSAAGRLRAVRRAEVPQRLPDLPPRDEWPARLRECGAPAVQVALAMAGGRWDRLYADGRGVTVA